MLYVYFKYVNQQGNEMVVPLVIQPEPNASLTPFQNFMNSKILNERRYGLKVSSMEGTEVPLPTLDKKTLEMIELTKDPNFSKLLEVLKPFPDFNAKKQAMINGGMSEYIPVLETYYNCIDDTVLVNQIKQSLEDDIDFEELKYSLVKAGRSEQFANAIIPSVSAFFEFVEMRRVFDLQIDVTSMDNIALTQKLLLHYKKIGKMEFNFLKSPSNKTTLQQTPEDEIMFRVPTYKELVEILYKAGQIISDKDDGGDIDAYVSAVPAQKNLQRPYANEGCFNVYYRKLFDEGKLSEDDLKLMEGDARNNDLPLQDNEMRLYNTLKELLQDCLVNSNPAVDAKDYIAKCEKEHITDLRFLNYIKALCVVLGKTNWIHTGFLPLSDSDVFYLKDGTEVGTVVKVDEAKSIDGSNDDDDDTEDTAEVGLSGYYTNDRGINGNPLQGDMVLYGLINEISRVDIYGPIELLIRLLRWGDRKPTRIYIPQFKQYLDTFDFRLKDDSGNIGDLTIRQVEGCDYVFEGLVNYPVKITDNNVIASKKFPKSVVQVPIAYKVRQYYNETNMSKIIIIPIFEAIFNDIKIARLTDYIPNYYNYYNPNLGKIDQVPELYVGLNQPYESAWFDIRKSGGFGKDYCTDELIASLMELGVKVEEFGPLKSLDRLLGDKSLKRKISDYEFSTKAEFVQLVDQLESGESVKDIIDANILRIFYGAFLNIANSVYKVSLESNNRVPNRVVLTFYKEMCDFYKQNNRSLSVKNLVPISMGEVEEVVKEDEGEKPNGMVNAFGEIETVNREDNLVEERQPQTVTEVKEETKDTPVMVEDVKPVDSFEVTNLKAKIAELEREKETLKAENAKRVRQLEEMHANAGKTPALGELVTQMLTSEKPPKECTARPFKNSEGKIILFFLTDSRVKGKYWFVRTLEGLEKVKDDKEITLNEVDFLLSAIPTNLVQNRCICSFDSLNTLALLLQESKRRKSAQYKLDNLQDYRMGVINNQLHVALEPEDLSLQILKQLVPTEKDDTIVMSPFRDKLVEVIKLTNSLKTR